MSNAVQEIIALLLLILASVFIIRKLRSNMSSDVHDCPDCGVSEVKARKQVKEY